MDVGGSRVKGLFGLQLRSAGDRWICFVANSRSFFPCCSAAHPVVTVLDRACELDGGESGGDATAAPAVEMDSVTVAASVTRSRPGFMGLAFPVIVDSRLLSFRPKRNRS